MFDPNRFYDYSMYDSDGEREHSQTYINRGNRRSQNRMADNVVAISDYKYNILKNELEDLLRKKQIYDRERYHSYREEAQIREIIERHDYIENYLNSYTFKVISPCNLTTTTIHLFNGVVTRNCRNEKIQTFVIVPEGDVNIRNGYICVHSPFATGLLGHKTGDIVGINVPKGVIEVEILEIFIPIEYGGSGSYYRKPEPPKPKEEKVITPPPPKPSPKPKTRKAEPKDEKVIITPPPPKEEPTSKIDKIKMFLKKFRGKRVMINNIYNFIKKNPDIDYNSLKDRCEQHNDSLK